jgi:hypothetical protein
VTPPQPKEAAGAPSLWASYFAVKDADATFAQGAVFAIIKNAMPAA